MSLVDKLLLGLLVVLLPLGVLVSYLMFSNADVSDGQIQEAQVDTTKLEQLIEDVTQQKAQEVQQAQIASQGKLPIDIAQVSFATESGTLKVKGRAPQPTTSVLVTATYLPINQTVAELEPEEEPSVQGISVDTVSVIPSAGGEFVYEYAVDSKQTDGIIELRLEQDDIVRTVRFDLKQKKQVL